jgi:hypothetical protein
MAPGIRLGPRRGSWRWRGARAGRHTCTFVGTAVRRLTLPVRHKWPGALADLIPALPTRARTSSPAPSPPPTPATVAPAPPPATEPAMERRRLLAPLIRALITGSLLLAASGAPCDAQRAQQRRRRPAHVARHELTFPAARRDARRDATRRDALPGHRDARALAYPSPPHPHPPQKHLQRWRRPPGPRTTRSRSTRRRRAPRSTRRRRPS